MSTMIAEVCEASKEAGASEEKCKAAATAVADYDNRFDRMDVDLIAVKGDLAVVRAELAMVKGIVSGVGFGVLHLVSRSFWPH